MFTWLARCLLQIASLPPRIAKSPVCEATLTRFIVPPLTSGCTTARAISFRRKNHTAAEALFSFFLSVLVGQSDLVPEKQLLRQTSFLSFSFSLVTLFALSCIRCCSFFEVLLYKSVHSSEDAITDKRCSETAFQIASANKMLVVRRARRAGTCPKAERV